jgi:hypothetical protein
VVTEPKSKIVAQARRSGMGVAMAFFFFFFVVVVVIVVIVLVDFFLACLHDGWIASCLAAGIVGTLVVSTWITTPRRITPLRKKPSPRPRAGDGPDLYSYQLPRRYAYRTILQRSHSYSYGAPKVLFL